MERFEGSWIARRRNLTKEQRQDELEDRFICSECDNKGLILNQDNEVFKCSCEHGQKRKERWPQAMDQTILWIPNPYWENK